MKVLCLHGFTQNGPLFARKASAIRKALGKAGYETTFLTAPLKVESSDLPFQTEEGIDMRTWWVINESDPQCYNMEQALQTVKDCVVKDGPFDGILGFSQGAGFAGALCNYIEELVPGHPPFKFGIFYSGFRLKAPFNQHFYENKKITVPTMHVLGTLDTIVSEERTMALYELCDEKTRKLLKHPGGHYVPSQKSIIESIMAFVNEPTPKEQTEEPEENWDAFDSIGKS